MTRYNILIVVDGRVWTHTQIVADSVSQAETQAFKNCDLIGLEGTIELCFLANARHKELFKNEIKNWLYEEALIEWGQEPESNDLLTLLRKVD